MEKRILPSALSQMNFGFIEPPAWKLTVPDNVKKLIDDGVLFVCNHSGGKDSQALLIEMLKVIPKSQILVVHASLGEIEWEGALELAQKQAEDAGVPFIVARAEKTFLDMVERRFEARPEVPSWPSSATRQCTSDLKRGPIEREIRRYVRESGQTLMDRRFNAVVNCAGMRAQESASRSKYPVWKQNERNTIASRDWFEWLPIHGMTEDQVFDCIRSAGQEPHWAYKEGNRRLSCVFCLFGHPKDLANGARLRPELYAKYVEMEKRTGYTMHQSRRSLPELVAQGMST
jgi:3'-phosphoadenosine 5'-phosphosulfate sulfotransferase (PAPS reductase)/FAD synthetase